ncbi:MAG: ferritin [Phycisphaerae bacterium]
MMISEEMNQALNRQITNELNAAYDYQAMAFGFHEKGLRVFGARFKAQADEEHGHAMKIAKFIQDVGGHVVFEALAKPRADHASAQSMVEAALDNELRVTKQVNELVAQAERENDYATRSFLQWFVDEQVEEVSAMSELLQLVKTAGEANLFFVENRLSKMMAAG